MVQEVQFKDRSHEVKDRQQVVDTKPKPNPHLEELSKVVSDMQTRYTNAVSDKNDNYKESV